MKKLVALALAGIMTLSMAGCGSIGTKGTESTAQKNEARKQLVVGFDASFPPYGYIDEATNEYVGFDLDLAAEVCERNNWELVKTPIDWDAKDFELNSGAIDCIWNGFTINGREDSYTWSEPYVDNSQVFVVAKDSGIKEFKDLAGKTVLVQADSSALHALQPEVEATDDAETKVENTPGVWNNGNTPSGSGCHCVHYHHPLTVKGSANFTLYVTTREGQVKYFHHHPQATAGLQQSHLCH